MVRVALTSRAPKTDSGNTPTFGARPSISLIIESAIPLFKIGPKCPARLNGRLGLLSLPFTLATGKLSLLAHHDRPPFSGRPSLTGHCGHGWTSSLPRPVASDPELT